MAKKYSEFVDDLLLALVVAGQETPGKYIDVLAVAAKANLEYVPGWAREAAGQMKDRGWLRATFLSGPIPDGAIMAMVTGDGLERADSIAEMRRGEAAQVVDTVPASDRYVRIDHNAQQYQQTEVALTQTIDAVASDNEYAAEEPEDRGQRLAELEASHRLLQAPLVDLAWLKPKLIATLRYLAEKFAGAMIGKAAAAALALVVEWLKDLL
ncbi:MAG: hypothetical protein ACREFM_02530 [Hypericibacter sp.]